MTQPQIELKAEDSKMSKVYIYSREHMGYWRKNGKGYTASIDLAGTFDEEEARKILAGVGPEKQLQIEQIPPRSSPHVAPGLRDAWNAFEEKAIASNGYFDLYANRWPEYDVLRDAIAAAQIQPDTGLRDFAEWLWKLQADYLTAGAYQERETVLYVTDELLKRIGITETDVVADIAAQGGTVVDREKLIAGIRDFRQGFLDKATRNRSDGTYEQAYRAEEEARIYGCLIEAIERGDFNSAVPSAPGGAPRCAQCQHMRTNHEHLPIDGLMSPATYCGYPECPCKQYYEDEALGAPQGSDSLVWSKVLPTEAGRYLWKSPGGAESLLLLYKEKRGIGMWNDDQFLPIAQFTGAWFCGPIVIPEPVQPPSAGEAKERGEDE